MGSSGSKGHTAISRVTAERSTPRSHDKPAILTPSKQTLSRVTAKGEHSSPTEDESGGSVTNTTGVTQNEIVVKQNESAVTRNEVAVTENERVVCQNEVAKTQNEVVKTPNEVVKTQNEIRVARCEQKADERRVFEMSEVERHGERSSCWLVINARVYDVTGFLGFHPGGEDVLLEQAGTDATDKFEDIMHSTDADELMKEYEIGTI